MASIGWSISTSDLDRIRRAQRELFLGIILRSGEISVRIANSSDCPSHETWISQENIPIESIQGAFSFFVREGEVTGLLPASALNAPPAFTLSQRQKYAVLSLLPIAVFFSVLE
jgi:hypothetical protein